MGEPVCGAGGGIGLATSSELLAAGLDVALADIKDGPSVLARGPGSVARSFLAGVRPYACEVEKQAVLVNFCVDGNTTSAKFLLGRDRQQCSSRDLGSLELLCVRLELVDARQPLLEVLLGRAKKNAL